MKFFILDAFSESLFGGNPAGVVMVDEKSGFPDVRVMQKVAAELRYSETVFVKHEAGNEYALRYFTVTDEVDLCGHATIAAFSVIRDIERGPGHAGFDTVGSIDGDVTTVPTSADPDIERGSGPSVADRTESCWTAVTKAGRLQIEVRQDMIFMDMASPQEIAIIDDDELMTEIYASVGLNASDVAGPVELISTGLPDLILPVHSKEVLNGMNPDFDKMTTISEHLGIVGIHAFAYPDNQPDSFDLNENPITVHCRNFAPLYGIDEEAATGTANGASSHYLYKNGFLKDNSIINFIQGEAMGRPSSVHAIVTLPTGSAAGKGSVGGGIQMTAENDGVPASDMSKPRIQIGGRCALLACGEIFI